MSVHPTTRKPKTSGQPTFFFAHENVNIGLHVKRQRAVLRWRAVADYVRGEAMGSGRPVESGSAQHSGDARPLANRNFPPESEQSQLVGILNEGALLWRVGNARLQEVHGHVEKGRKRV